MKVNTTISLDGEIKKKAQEKLKKEKQLKIEGEVKIVGNSITNFTEEALKEATK